MKLSGGRSNDVLGTVSAKVITGPLPKADAQMGLGRRRLSNTWPQRNNPPAG